MVQSNRKSDIGKKPLYFAIHGAFPLVSGNTGVTEHRFAHLLLDYLAGAFSGLLNHFLRLRILRVLL